MKKSVMLRIDNLEKINDVKTEYKQLAGINLTTENIFNKGLETFEKSIAEQKIAKLANPELKITQIAMLKDAINQSLGMDYLIILTQETFKAGPLSLLIKAALEHYDLVKFKLIANPELKASAIDLLLKAEQKKEFPLGLMASLVNPHFSVAQLSILTEAYTKQGLSWDQIEDVANPQLGLVKMSMIIDAFTKK